MLKIRRPTIQPSDPADSRQSFNFGPLPPGFGHTMGNALRRVMTAYIPGAAVTWVRFDKALHEFDTLTGVTEDVSDIILNIKDLVLKSHSEEPVVLRVDVVGPANVTGSDFDVNPDVEVVNKDLHIAALDANARFVLDATVEQGVGYQGAEVHPADVGVQDIPIDAIYSPIRRVSYHVESVPGEQGDVSDTVVLDVLTDGSMTPAEALSSAGGTLRQLSQLLESLDERGNQLVVSDIVEDESLSEELLAYIEELGLSTRTLNCLKRAEIIKVGDLVKMTPSALLALPNFGEKALDEVVERLDDRGLTLSSSMTDGLRASAG